MPAPAFPASIEASRAALIEEIGPAPDLTFVRGLGNAGDELIYAGTRALLAGHVWREIGVDALGRAEGELALLCGGGAWSRVYHEYMPVALAVAERRFDRVIVLPSSFETEEDAVREALRGSRATVFAREPESYRRIAGLCRARQAHDCAFFFDFSSWTTSGTGTLDAFRTDAESAGDRPPEGNDDISATRASLDGWLGAIAGHARVRTDRAHVMIAAALMGKDVEVASGSYFKVDALAGTLPAGLRPGRYELPAAVAESPSPGAARPRGPSAGPGAPRVTALVLSRNRPAHVRRAVESVLAADVGAAVSVLDNNSTGRTRKTLADLAEREPAVSVTLSDRNLGCALGRRLGSEQIESELTLFLDDDAELMPGALDHLVADLDAHPEAGAVSALVVHPDDVVQHFAGWPEIGGGLASFPLDGNGLAAGDPALPATGPCGWVPGTAALIRTSLLREVPISTRMRAYYEDNDWSLRVERARPGSFRRCREAVAVHHSVGDRRPASPFVARARAAEHLAALASFYAAHGLILDRQLLLALPELGHPDGRLDIPAARLVLELAAARGATWVLTEWLSGGLEPLLVRPDPPGRMDELLARVAALEAEAGESARVAREREGELGWLRERHRTLERVENGGWWRLHGRLAPVLGLARRVRGADGGRS